MSDIIGKRLDGQYRYNTTIWDIATGTALLTLPGRYASRIVWSPNGKRIATIGADHSVTIWNAMTGKELNSASAPGYVSSVAWSPGGARLATNGDTAHVWDVSTGQELLTLRGHTGSVNSVAWSPDGKRLATASQDGTVQIYAMDIHDLMNLARTRVTAHPSDEGCKKYLGVDKCPPIPKLPWW